MKILISWMLLVLGVTLNSGHYIYKVEKEDAPAYEVESNPRGLVVVNTKYERPSLKDILYHDLFERFYGKEERLITERPFTNSHGLPFLEEFENENIPQKNNLEESDDGLFEETKPLTDEAVKTAYKTKSYLFDQMRQRSDVASEDFIERKKRQAEIPYFPEARQMSAYGEEPFAPPNTYGMNLNPNGGYVWNNLNNPPSLYELGKPSNGNENTSQNPPETSETPVESSAPEETLAATSSAPEIPDSGSSEDIYVNINRPAPANEGILPNELKDIPEENNETPTPNDNSDTFEPNELTKSATPETNNEDPNGKAIEIPETPIESVSEPNSQEVKPDEELEIPETPVQSVSEASSQEVKPEEELEIPATPIESVSELNSQEVKLEEPAPVNEDTVKLKTLDESSSAVPDEIEASSGEAGGNPEEDKVKEMPEAPTLPPLNYDGLPDYIREAISTTERIEYEQTDNPSLNPQPSSEDKEMEGVMATAQPLEDIPRTYGMNLTSGSGKVWNDLVNPPVSYEVGSTESNQPEEPQETTQAPVIIEEPVTAEQPEPETPTEEPEKDKEPANPEENVTPIDIPETTEQPENASNDDLILPGTENNEESEPTELPETTTETFEISDATESDIKLTENPETEAPVIEPVTEEIKPVTELPEITTNVTAEPDVIEDNEPTDDIEPVEIVTAAPAEEPVGPELEEPESGSGETGDEVVEPEEESNGDEEKHDIMSELLKSEQFWKWLGEWMAAYTELMEKHIRKIAIQEICNARRGADVCPLDKKPEDSGPIIKDGKLTINGNEIDLNDNFNQLKRGNKGHSVDATTIYGNSVGNDKVTNVFIFNPNNAKDILEGLKPENNSNVNIIIEEDKETVTAVPEIVENREIKGDGGMEDRRDGEAGVEVSKEDIKEATEKQVKALSNSEESKDGIKSEDVEIEKVTEAIQLLDEKTEFANVKEVKANSSELGVENVTEAKLKSEIQ